MLGDIPYSSLKQRDILTILFQFLIAQNRLCTGDCLLSDPCGRTDFLKTVVIMICFILLRKISNLPERYLIYPGHDYQNRYISNIKKSFTKIK